MQELTRFIRDIPDFPKPGILFKDITPLVGNHGAFSRAIEMMSEPYIGRGITQVVAIEARGFVFAGPIALRLQAGLALVRKPGKLPYRTERASYDLEYGSDSVELHVDAVGPGDQVLLVDDVIATGGTMKAAAQLVRQMGAEVGGIVFLIELGFLGGRNLLDGYPVHSVLRYD